MEVNITLQALEALYALLLGAACGVFYDLLSIFRRSVKSSISSVLMAGLFDALFCLVCAGGFFLLGFGPGGGKLRLFLILFVIPGGLLYFIFFSRLVTKLLYSLLNIIRLIIQWCLFPFKYLNKQQKRLKRSIKGKLRYKHKRLKIRAAYTTEIYDKK